MFQVGFPSNVWLEAQDLKTLGTNRGEAANSLQSTIGIQFHLRNAAYRL